MVVFLVREPKILFDCLPYLFLYSVLCKIRENASRCEGIADHNQPWALFFLSGFLRLSTETMASLFQPTLDKIKDAIENVLNSQLAEGKNRVNVVGWGEVDLGQMAQGEVGWGEA